MGKRRLWHDKEWTKTETELSALLHDPLGDDPSEYRIHSPLLAYILFKWVTTT
jgi:hypothetical protein